MSTARQPARLEPRVYLAGSEDAEATITSAAPGRYPLWVLGWNAIGLQWVRSAAGAGGTATIQIYGTANQELAEAGGNDPATNLWWKILPAADQFASEPAAAAGSDITQLAIHGLDGILVVVTPSATLDLFKLSARLRWMSR